MSNQNLPDSDHERVRAILQRMTPFQLKWMARVAERMVVDQAFGVRFEREALIFQQLVMAQNDQALERWIARKSLELIVNRVRGDIR